MSTPGRDFPLGDVISGAFGVLVSPNGIGAVYEILNYLTGDNLYTHQIPRAGRAVQGHVLRQYPQLAPLEAACKDVTPENWRAWLDEQIARYGETLALFPMPPGEWLHIDPLEELQAMAGDKSVIVVRP